MSKVAATSGRRRIQTHSVLYGVTLAAVLGLTMLPFLWLLQMSFKTGVEAFQMPPSLLFTPTLNNYRDLLATRFPHFFLNSIAVSTTSTVLSILIGIPGAYALSRARFRLQSGLYFWILSTRMAPPIGFAIPFFLVYRDLRLLDTRLGLILIYLTFSLGLVVWTMRGFFDGIPRSLEEAAYIDGAGPLQTFLQITLPLSGPGLAATAILCFLLSWNDFFYALILTRSDAMTAPVGIINFLNYEGWEWGKIAAGGSVIMFPVVIFSLLVRKYLIRGLMIGALKE